MPSNRPRLLVTGFGPFPGMPRNPSAEIARRVAGSPRWRRLEVAVQCLILPTTYAALDECLTPALAREAPDAVLMIGVAGRFKGIRIERRAQNRTSLLLADAAGRLPSRLTLAAGGTARTLRPSPLRMRAVLKRHALPCRVSQDAGRYLCNAAYYRALGHPCPVLFLHVPKPPARRPRRRINQAARLSWNERLAAAFVDVAVQLLNPARRTAAPSGCSTWPGALIPQQHLGGRN